MSNEHQDAEADNSAEKLALDLLREASDAALAGDPVRMLTALYKSGVLDGLCRRLAAAWDGIAFEDVQLIIAEAVDVLYQTVQSGQSKGRIIPFLLKVAIRKAFDFEKKRRRVDALDPGDLEREAANEAGREFAARERQEGPVSKISDDLDFEERRRLALGIARGLLPRLGQQHVQDVMSYIFDAIEAGQEDISNDEIASALGLTGETVRTSKSRGFARLEKIAKEEKLLPEGSDLLGLDENEASDETSSPR
jgi:DNA-directed RNA polymerase specialized sigma24 family protein